MRIAIEACKREMMEELQKDENIKHPGKKPKTDLYVKIFYLLF